MNDNKKTTRGNENAVKTTLWTKVKAFLGQNKAKLIALGAVALLLLSLQLFVVYR